MVGLDTNAFPINIPELPRSAAMCGSRRREDGYRRVGTVDGCQSGGRSHLQTMLLAPNTRRPDGSGLIGEKMSGRS